MHRGSYEDLKVWQKSMSLVLNIYECTRKFPRDERYELVSQMNRAAVSIPSNIAEGSQRSTKNDFAHFISISKGSLAELRTQIMIARSLKYLEQNDSEKLLLLSEEINKMLFALFKSLKSDI